MRAWLRTGWIASSLAATLAAATASAPTPANDAGGEATFSWVSYDGHDPEEQSFAASPAEYRNPIIPGFQPDPSIVRVGDDFYLTNSSFAFFPGLPIYHSRDLVNWAQLGNAIDRPGQFNFSGLGIARGIFAPTLRWHEGRFYIVGTCVDCGSSFIISAENAAGPWSDPVWLPSVDGIDPDLFVDDDGRAWIANNGAPQGPPLYAGHRAIWLQEFDLKSKTARGGRTVIVNGGVDILRHPIWIEGPHLIKHDLRYYLIAAEGGTAGGHSEVVFRSDRVRGPYAPAGANPILTQRDLESGRAFPIAAAGHADFVQLADGAWWSVFLATRPYEANLSNLGRETFLLPVTWRQGWPQILAPGIPVPHVVRRPLLPRGPTGVRSRWRDRFTSQRLAPDWEMIRTPTENWYRTGNGHLTLQARAASISGGGSPSFLGKRQRHANAIVSTELRYVPRLQGDRAGLVAFADERHYYFFGLSQTLQGPKVMVALRNGIDDPIAGRVIASADAGARKEPLRLRISVRGGTCEFSYALAGGAWLSLLSDADGRVLASETTNQFTGAILGVYAERDRADAHGRR